jgi:hypothetical protein
VKEINSKRQKATRGRGINMMMVIIIIIIIMSVGRDHVSKKAATNNPIVHTPSHMNIQYHGGLISTGDG